MSFLTVGAMVVLWVTLIHISLTSQNHPVFRLLLVLSAGAVFWAISVEGLGGIPPNALWITPGVGLIANLWARVVRLDIRTLASAAVGLLVASLLVWAVLPAHAEKAETDLMPLPDKSVVIQSLPSAPPISPDFLHQISKNG